MMPALSQQHVLRFVYIKRQLTALGAANRGQLLPQRDERLIILEERSVFVFLYDIPRERGLPEGMFTLRIRNFTFAVKCTELALPSLPYGLRKLFA